MPKPSLKQRISYWFDNQLARRPFLMLGLLGLVALFIVIVFTFIATAFSIQPNEYGAGRVFWDFLFQALTPNPYDTSANWLYLVMITFVTLISLLMVSILIGFVTTGIHDRLDKLRRGRSNVLEEGHTLILGWSHQVFTIVSELADANESRKGGAGAVIVILADEDMVTMTRTIEERVSKLKKTRVICRSGSPMDPDDLEIGSPHTARSIIVLPPDDANPDAYVIKTILAIVHSPSRDGEHYHIVTQIESRHNLDVVKMVSPKDDIHALLVGDQIARISVQASRQPGLSAVYTELLNFSGDEIYFQKEPELANQTYADALMAYEDTAVIGLRREDGEICLNPPMDTRIEVSDFIIGITADDTTMKLSHLTSIPVSETAILPIRESLPLPAERCLILGWNSKAPVIIRELDDYVSPGSELVVAAKKPSDPEEEAEIQASFKNLHNLRAEYRSGDVSDRQVLEGLGIAAFKHVIVLAYEDLDKQAADAETMVTLLHLRQLAKEDGRRVGIVSEMLDMRNRRLAEVAKVDDFIVSDHLISLMLAQLSENRELYTVFNDLFDSYGAELYFKPAREYIDVSQTVTFYTVVEAARRRGETAIGYRLMKWENDEKHSYGIHTNPRKSEPIDFSPQDTLIVLAERQ